jgi:hypothetical protein
VKVLRRLLSLRPLLFPPHQDLPAWLRLASICRRQGHLTLAGNILRDLSTSMECRSCPPPSLAAPTAILSTGPSALSLEVPGKDERSDLQTAITDALAAKHARVTSVSSTGASFSLSSSSSPPCPPQCPLRVQYALAKHLWATAQHAKALRLLHSLDRELTASIGPTLPPSSSPSSPRALLPCPHGPAFDVSTEASVANKALLAKVLVRRGNWALAQHEMGRGREGEREEEREGLGMSASLSLTGSGSVLRGSEGGQEGGRDGGRDGGRGQMVDILGHFQRATVLSPTSYKAWHAWAAANHAMAEVEGRQERTVRHAGSMSRENGGRGGRACKVTL